MHDRDAELFGEVLREHGLLVDAVFRVFGFHEAQAALAAADVARVVDEDLDEESDPPVIFTSDEIEAAMDRTKNTTPQKASDGGIRALYPLLFAATLEHEDVLMACARLLDESIDASLLREVTNYLENVEAKSHSIQ
jgi:hypothetical protein